MRSPLSLLSLLLLLALAALLAGCGATRYEIQKPDGTRVSIRSSREFPDGIKVAYEGLDANGHSAKLQVEAGSVRNAQPSPLEQAAAASLGAVLGRALGIAPAPAAAPAPASPATPGSPSSPAPPAALALPAPPPDGR